MIMQATTVLNLLCFLLYGSNVNTARILAVLPTPSISHQVVYRPFTQELIKRGHQVTVITPDPFFTNVSHNNLTEIDVHDISYDLWQKYFLTNTAIGSVKDILKSYELIIKAFSDVFEKQLKAEEVQKIIKSEAQYDLLIIEDCIRPALVFSHFFKNVPVILISSFGMMVDANRKIGSPSHPFLYPNHVRNRIYNLNLWDKIQELICHLKVSNIYSLHEIIEDKMLRNVIGPDVPPLQELAKNVDLVFYNNHPMWADNLPVPSNVVYIGGIYEAPKKDLTEELKTYLDTSKSGVIYLSFGTNIKPSLLSKKKVDIFVKVFSELQYDILWRWDTYVAGISKNVKITQWVPQSDLLKHPNIKLFISHGGFQSTEEAIIAGVPLIGLPMLGDQWYNVEKYKRFGIGVRLDIDILTEDDLRAAIKNVIEDKSFRENINKLRRIMTDQPQSALDRAVWWTEYVLRHGGAKHLHSPAAHMSSMEYYEIELVIAISSLLLLTTFIVMLCIYYMSRYIYLKINHKIKND